jgi:small-conductance mechanosensitive channel
MKIKISVLSMLFAALLFFFSANAIAANGSDKKTLPTQQNESSEITTQAVQPPSESTDTADASAAETDLSPISQLPERQFISQWLHMLDSRGDGDNGESSVMAYGPQVPGDLLRTIQSTREGGPGFWSVFFRSILAIGLGFLFVFIFKRTAKSKLDGLKELSPPQSETLAMLWTGLVRNLPALAGMLVLAISATITFLILAGDIAVKGRMLFQLLLGIILIFTICSIISRIIFSPDDSELRPFEIDQTLVKPLYNAFKYSLAILASGLLFVSMVAELGARPQSVSWVVMILGTIIIALYCYLIIYLKKPVSTALLARLEEEGGGWIKRQLASYWHSVALLYLALVWLISIGQQMAGTAQGKGQFIISMLIVPIYFGLSYGGKLIISAVIESLELGKVQEDELADPADELERKEESIRRQRAITEKAYATFRLVLIAVLATWLLSLWGYNIPFATAAMKALFQSIIILALALTFWRFASAYIENKLEEATPEVEESEDDDDNEFGGAAPGGRTHTLLPMLRKVIGSILVVMVILIVISSLGVNIGPLLAGAGVLGLAIGFGAQKLVSDILSGFFFLLDDAFRVGEYIQTGSIRGTVEAITLRNVMLRHHLGMLQVVPHSDLGAVTNYMRGGIVIKFPLEFPYDTDIDQVRKIIKKVGVAMLEDEDLGDDFILPVKSQGVYQITNSVMVIRAKFTSKPGKQFVIKREALRRITEALNAKGIYYAHRKVIVDFPDQTKPDSVDQETQQKVLQAAAAAALLAEEQQPKADPTEP